jgi:hypothetical protein
MHQRHKWFAPVFVGILIVAAVAVGACGRDPAGRVLLNTVDSLGDDSIPSDSTPPDSVPPDSIPPDSIPPDSIPPDSIPPDSIPSDSIPPDSIPPDTLPPPSGPASITVTPASQERAVGDSGVVTATVRDSAGREIWPAAIEWDLTDTSTVLRIRVRRTSFTIFDAVGPGRAVLIARFQAFADTAIVVVR